MYLFYVVRKSLSVDSPVFVYSFRDVAEAYADLWTRRDCEVWKVFVIQGKCLPGSVVQRSLFQE